MALLEAGPAFNPEHGLQDVPVAVRSAASRSWRRRKSGGKFRGISGAQWRVENRGRALHLRSGSEFSVVSFAHRRRPHESLGPHRAAFFSRRFQIAYTRDGLGEDWPISYDDIAPYYDKVESYIGVFGSKENVPSAPERNFSATSQAALQRTDHQEGLRQAQHSLHSLAAGDSHQSAERPPCLATIAASAVAAARRLRISAPARC